MPDARPLHEIRLTPRYFRLALRHFGKTPALRRAILEGTALSEEELEAGDVLVPLDQQLRQQDNLERLFGADWAVSAPELWGHSSHGLLSVANQLAPTLREALMLIVERGAVVGPVACYELDVNGPTASFRYMILLDLEERHWRRSLEVGFIGLRSLLYLYLSRPPSEARYHFACAEHGYADRVRRVLGGDVVFGAPHNAVEFPAAWLEQKSPLHDPAAYRLATWRLGAELETMTAWGSTRARVERILQTTSGRRASLPEVAAALGFSRRTLVRRLAAEGVSFRQILEAEQAARAAALMRLSSLKMADISEQMGYSDPASFARARRRWARRLAVGPG